MPDETVSLAFFRASHYILHAETGAVLTPVPSMTAEDYAPEKLGEGWETVTKDELFARWPVWAQIERQLFSELSDDNGSRQRGKHADSG